MTILSSAKEYERGNSRNLKIHARSLDRVRERSENTEFELFLDVVTGDVKERASSQLPLVNLGRLE